MGEVWRATDTTLGRDGRGQAAQARVRRRRVVPLPLRDRGPARRRRCTTRAWPRSTTSARPPRAGRLRQRPALPGDGARRRPAALGAAAPRRAARPGRHPGPARAGRRRDRRRPRRRHRAPRRQAGEPAGHAVAPRSRSPTSASPAPPRGSALTETGQVMGTPQYLSPEQAEGTHRPRPASDVYSLGVVAFECLAGRRPFVAETAVATALAHLREPVPDAARRGARRPRRRRPPGAVQGARRPVPRRAPPSPPPCATPRPRRPPTRVVAARRPPTAPRC